MSQGEEDRSVLTPDIRHIPTTPEHCQSLSAVTGVGGIICAALALCHFLMGRQTAGTYRERYSTAQWHGPHIECLI